MIVTPPRPAATVQAPSEAEPGPGRAAQRQQGSRRAECVGSPLRRLEDEPVRPVEADERGGVFFRGDAHPGQPGASQRTRQRRGLEALREDPPARPDKGRLAERIAPVPQAAAA